MSISLVNNAAANVVTLENIATTYKARFHVLYWNVEIGDVEVNEAEGATVDSPTMKASVQAISMTDPNVSTGLPISLTSAQNLEVAEGSNNTIEFLIGPTAGTTVENTILLKNQCSFPLIFNVTPDGGTVQQFTVGPNSQWPMSLATMFTAYARVHGYPNEPSGSDGYDTPTVAFGSQNATLTIWPDNSKGESFHIAVT